MSGNGLALEAVSIGLVLSWKTSSTLIKIKPLHSISLGQPALPERNPALRSSPNLKGNFIPSARGRAGSLLSFVGGNSEGLFTPQLRSNQGTYILQILRGALEPCSPLSKRRQRGGKVKLSAVIVQIYLHFTTARSLPSHYPQYALHLTPIRSLLSL